MNQFVFKLFEQCADTQFKYLQCHRDPFHFYPSDHAAEHDNKCKALPRWINYASTIKFRIKN